jgi:polysaccharide export outer membrane protein
MQAILLDPSENIYVQPGDTISVAREQQTFTAAGATGKNAVIPFDAIGITLEQGIANAGGLTDSRADPAGVFVIRFEQANEYDQLRLARPEPGTYSQIPVIYQFNMRDANSYFLARRFPIRNKDILFVSNASLADKQKVMNLLLPIIGVGATIVAVGAVTR